MNMGKSETPWPVFRLGEIYLNLAEAAMELNKSSEALDAVNKIRERAGIALLSNINMEKIIFWMNVPANWHSKVIASGI